jgi:hypothetical protein
VLLDGSGELLLVRTAEIVEGPSPLDRVLDRSHLDLGFCSDVLRCSARFIDTPSPGLRLQPAGPMSMGRLSDLTCFIAGRG